MGFLQPTASNFKVENSYPVKVEDCSTLQIDTVFSSETLVTYIRLHGVVCQRTILFKTKTTCTLFWGSAMKGIGSRPYTSTVAVCCKSIFSLLAIYCHNICNISFETLVYISVGFSDVFVFSMCIDLKLSWDYKEFQCSSLHSKDTNIFGDSMRICRRCTSGIRIIFAE
jgi:hypothetical protein